MGFGINSSIAGATNREIELEVLANNIANVQTTGYKETRISFGSELNKEEETADNLVQKAAQYGKKVQQAYNWDKGSIYRTENPLDIAIQSDGFFVVDTEAGERFTRGGTFSLSSEGMIVTQQGFPVMGDSGPIQIGSGETPVISKDGSVLVNGQSVGKLKIVDFEDRNKLKLEGQNLFSAVGTDTKELSNVVVAQGYLENSNVNMVRNLTRIIEVSRAYESHQKSMQKQFAASQILNQISKMG